MGTRVPIRGRARIIPGMESNFFLTKQQRDEWAVLRSLATRGPYVAVLPREQSGTSVAHTGPTFADSFPYKTSIRTHSQLSVSPEQTENDARFFAASWTAVGVLLATISKLDTAITRLEQHAAECTRNGADGHAAVLSEHAAELRALLPV